MSETTTSLKRGRRALAVAAAVSLGLLSVALTGAAANATAVSGPVTNTTGSLTIHKYAYPANGTQNPSGTGGNPTSSPIDGVVFQVCAVGNVTSLADTSNLGWAQVNGLNAASGNGTTMTGTVAGVNGTTTFPLSGCTSVTTAGGGIASFPSLPIGAYWVHEVSAPAGVTPAGNFVVTVPTPADTTGGQSNTGTWEYNVNVYPKNAQTNAPTKTISDQATNGVLLGSNIGFTINQVVPALPTGQTYNKFIVTDTLDSKLTYNPASLVVKVGATTLALTTDYTATLNTTTNQLVVTLTPTGLTKIAAGQTVSVSFNAVANATGTINNQAIVNVNDLVAGGQPTNTVVSRWGGLAGTKTDSNATPTGLAGAVFQVYMTNNTTGTCTASDATVGGVVTTATSGANGAISVAGLWVGDSNQNVTNRCYILKEITAPAGFVLPTGAAALTSVNVTPTTTSTTSTFTIKNQQQIVPGLPLTGGDGAAILTTAGIGLVGLAIGGVLLARRRQRQAEEV